MVSGFHFSKDHERIMSGEARPIVIASNSSVLCCAFRKFNKSFTFSSCKELKELAAIGSEHLPTETGRLPLRGNLRVYYSSSSSMLIPSGRISFNSTLNYSGIPGSIA